jgi:hypothetical protein
VVDYPVNWEALFHLDHPKLSSQLHGVRIHFESIEEWEIVQELLAIQDAYLSAR